MAATLRVHSLAKELGVPSKVIIDKCRAEGIELKNHMAALSVGLAESIREWFTVGADVTSVEVADRIDVEQVRKHVRKPRVAEGDAGDAVGGEAQAVTVEEAPPEQEADAAFAEPAREAPIAVEGAEAVTTEPAPGVIEAAQAVSGSAPASSGEIAAEAAPEEVKEEAPPAEVLAPAAQQPPVEPPAPPEPIRPAGPQLVPKPAELKGPQVVRIEAPDQVRTPRPRPRPAVVARGPAATPEESAPGSARRGRAVKGKRQDEAEAARRTRSPRRHGSSTDVDQRLREWRDQDLLERKERLASVTGHGLQQRRAAERRRQQSASAPGPSLRRDRVLLMAPISLKDFSAKTGAPFPVLAKKLMDQTGRLWMINQSIDAEQAELLALELGIEIEIEQTRTAYEALRDEFERRERPNLQSRPPVVAMLGHVDHGKTSLLDAIRKTKVAAGEAGGITQHIGAYRIDRGDWHVTFVDTPGHEAFTAMRARGANLTDVVVLVVAADDGVMPQTAEAINHAKAAKVTIVVALNKIDLPGIDVDRVYGQLAAHELVPADWGGEIDVIRTSATTGVGIDELVAHLSTLSELLELRADPTVPATGTVIEAQMREGRGVAAQVLVHEGTLRSGQFVVCGPGAGRIRALRDDRGQPIQQATPGTPVEVTGLDALPEAGDRLYVVKSLALAKEIAGEVRDRQREKSLKAGTSPRTASLESLVMGGADELPQLNLILRADVQGSVEVLKKSLEDFPQEKARLNLLHAGVGAVSEADVHLAKASNALIIGFHVVAEEHAHRLADQVGVEIRQYRVIYEIMDDLQKAVLGLLEPEEREEVRGAAEVRQVFNISRVGTIAGCYVTDGLIHRHHKARVIRDGVVVMEGKGLGSLKRFKDDAREVKAGLECGIKIEDFDDLKPGDIIQAYEVVEVAQEL